MENVCNNCIMNTTGMALPTSQIHSISNPKQRFKLIRLDKGASVSMARMSNCRVVYVQQGDAKIFYMNGNSIRVESTQFAFLLVRDTITIYAEQPSALMVLDILDMESICDADYFFDQGLKGESVRVFSPGEEVVHLFETVNRYMSLGLCSVEMHRVKEEELLLLLVMFLKNEAQMIVGLSSGHLSFQAKVRRCVSDCRTVQELAANMGMERAYFQKVFKRTFGISPYQWMQEQKSKDLLKVLTDSEFPLKHIAVDFGFASISKMNQFVKKYFGMTAKELRCEKMGDSLDRQRVTG